jgi:hypothetical protein
MAQLGKSKSVKIKPRMETWNRKNPPSLGERLKKAITPARVTKAKSTASTIGGALKGFMEWGASRQGTADMATDPFTPPRKHKRKITSRKKKR